jgi:hypothetical protein
MRETELMGWYRIQWPTTAISISVFSTTPASTSSVERVPVLRGTLSLHPNPTRDVAHLRGDIVAGSVIEVRDMPGRLVRSVRCEGGGEAVGRVMLVR